MTQHALIVDAHQALRTTVSAVDPADWALRTPCSEWNVTQVLQHAAGDQWAYAAAITGGPGPAEDPFAPSGRLRDAPLIVLDLALDATAGAWATVAVDARDVPNPLPHGPMSAVLASGACALDAAVHAWDIAVATGQPSPLTPELAEGLLPVARALCEPLRQWGAFGPVVPAEPGDDEAATLLRYLGRDPHWKA
ncbi:TIGR03086 family metal-binding protein [Longispora sp. NPDC051575]|uniref:TIGR03086 family metal-binding protein n=1 Tax=Longispora sp. NPDC051575 TaxID=3154943 RepID=UPI00343B9E1A